MQTKHNKNETKLKKNQNLYYFNRQFTQTETVKNFYEEHVRRAKSFIKTSQPMITDADAFLT